MPLLNFRNFLSDEIQMCFEIIILPFNIGCRRQIQNDRDLLICEMQDQGFFRFDRNRESMGYLKDFIDIFESIDECKYIVDNLKQIFPAEYFVNTNELPPRNKEFAKVIIRLYMWSVSTFKVEVDYKIKHMYFCEYIRTHSVLDNYDSIKSFLDDIKKNDHRHIRAHDCINNFLKTLKY